MSLKKDSRMVSDNMGVEEDMGFDGVSYDFSSFIIFKSIRSR